MELVSWTESHRVPIPFPQKETTFFQMLEIPTPLNFD